MMMSFYQYKFKDLIGETFKEIRGLEVNSDRVLFITKDSVYKLCHFQDCCEVVTILEISGDKDDLIGCPILEAGEVINRDPNSKQSEYDESFTWTFYTLSTIKGSVTIRWYGASNGYYSESVDFDRLTTEEIELIDEQ